MKSPVHSSRKTNWSRPLAELVGAAIDPVLVKQGFAEHDLILHWDDIVGERLAAVSRPIKLQWPPRPAGGRAAAADAMPQPATLMVRVEGAFAIDLQHSATQIVARVNAHLGWRCVGKLAFRQGPIARPERRPPRGTSPDADALARAAAALPAGPDDGLRDALTRLGAHVAQASRARPRPSGRISS